MQSGEQLSNVGFFYLDELGISNKCFNALSVHHTLSDVQTFAGFPDLCVFVKSNFCILSSFMLSLVSKLISKRLRLRLMQEHFRTVSWIDGSLEFVIKIGKRSQV